MARTNFVRKPKMLAWRELVEDARIKASALVRGEEYRVRSRMLGYENVACAVGISGSWLRRFINGYEDYVPKVEVLENIRLMHEIICKRIEADSERRQGRVSALQECLDAVSIAPRALQELEAPPRREAAAKANASGVRAASRNS